jgi:hypothetical protein
VLLLLLLLLLLLQALATNAQSLMESEPLQLSRLWKALLLLRVQGLAPPVLLLQVRVAVLRLSTVLGACPQLDCHFNS